MIGEVDGPKLTLEDAGKLFGNLTRAKVGMWVVRQDVDVPFASSDIARDLEANPDSVMSQLEKLKTAQMVRELERKPTKGLPRMFSRLEDPWWSLFEATIIAIESPPGQLKLF